ncbi:MAG TPA: hypothetical protein VFV77_03755, partial [Gammaproteobacteria bacterium]|nr:hypothetical protein [Gammaproteobacteria bacterium]
QICVELSTSGAVIGVAGGGATGTYDATNHTISVGATSATLTFAVSDTNGQALASTTSVNLIQSGIAGVTVSLPTNLPYTYPDSGCGPNVQTFTVSIVLSPPVTPPVNPQGTLQLQVITPSPGSAQTDSPVVTIIP